MMASQGSGITGRDPFGFVEQEEVSNMDLCGKEPMSSEWTDEKHSMYLKSMEASFVDQLYSSLDLGDWNSQKKHYMHARSSKHTEPHTSDQFKVQQNGSWQRIRFGNSEPLPQQAGESHFLQQNQWIQHFRIADRQVQATGDDKCCGSQNGNYRGRMALTGGLTNPVCQDHQDPRGREEFSDQNFGEEDNEQGGAGSMHATKRTKMFEAASSNDQEVPFGASVNIVPRWRK